MEKEKYPRRHQEVGLMSAGDKLFLAIGTVMVVIVLAVFAAIMWFADATKDLALSTWLVIDGIAGTAFIIHMIRLYRSRRVIHPLDVLCSTLPNSAPTDCDTRAVTERNGELPDWRLVYDKNFSRYVYKAAHTRIPKEDGGYNVIPKSDPLPETLR